jgi:class 3 adenylate cyclase
MKHENPQVALRRLRGEAHVLSSEFVFKEQAWEIWPYLAQTDQIERLAGAPPFKVGLARDSDGESRFVGRGAFAGARAVFEELPWEWFPPDRIVGERVFSAGVFKYAAIVIDGWEAGGGWKVRLQLRYVPRSTRWWSGGKKAAEQWLAAWLAALQDMETALSPVSFPADALALRPFGSIQGENGEILKRTAAAWKKQFPDSDIAVKLAGFITTAPWKHVTRLRPLALAEHWSRPADEVLGACLDGARWNFLAMQWDVLCPSCRRVCARSENLAAVTATGECEVCNLSFPVGLHRDVELSFAPRGLDESGAEALSGAPGHTPHVYAQFNLEPFSTRTIVLNLEPGRYRLRSRTLKGAMVIDAKEIESSGEMKIRLGSEFPIPERVFPCKAILRLENPDGNMKTLQLERLAYRDQSLTAADALASPQFQARFPRQIPGTGNVFPAGNRVFLFADFKASTALYEKMGDAAAQTLFHARHDEIRRSVDEHGGVVVRSLGDGILCLFSAPREALECARKIYLEFERWNSARLPQAPLALKMGLYEGPCVTFANAGNLDYAGAAVNHAVRLQRMAHGNDLVLPESTFNSENARTWFDRTTDLVVTHFREEAGQENLSCIRFVLPVDESLTR